MRKVDLGHQLTEKELAKLEKRIEELYKEAHDELEETVTAYFESFVKRDEEMKKLIGTIQNGKEWTEADYKQWRLNQIGRGKRFETLRDLMAERYTQANEVAVAYVNDATPSIYSLNRNYAEYTIDRGTGGALTLGNGKIDTSWTLFDERTVKRLISQQPDLMPYYPKEKALKRGIDLAYGKKQITSAVTSAILQGKSIPQIANELQKSMQIKEQSSTIRIARTAVTGAQNAGRMDTFAAAKKMGIGLRREWVATLDSRTRHSHAMLDGEKAEMGKPFKSELGDIMFPGDPSAEPANVYNCRCTLIAALDDADEEPVMRRVKNPETGEYELVQNMTYKEWMNWVNER